MGVRPVDDRFHLGLFRIQDLGDTHVRIPEVLHQRLALVVNLGEPGCVHSAKLEAVSEGERRIPVVVLVPGDLPQVVLEPADHPFGGHHIREECFRQGIVVHVPDVESDRVVFDLTGGIALHRLDCRLQGEVPQQVGDLKRVQLANPPIRGRRVIEDKSPRRLP